VDNYDELMATLHPLAGLEQREDDELQTDPERAERLRDELGCSVACSARFATATS
jgi:hypothetical protein